MFDTMDCGYPVSPDTIHPLLQEYCTEETTRYIPEDFENVCTAMSYGLPQATVSNAWNHFRIIKERILSL